MTQGIKIPTPKDLRKTVEEIVEKYGITDCIYESCIEEFSRVKLSELKEIHSIRIIRPFLLTWGQMQRWLGDVGVEKISQKLKQHSFAKKIEPLRRRNLRSPRLGSLEILIVELFNELMLTEFKSSKSGKLKPVGSTATAKVLHLCCPDLFVMWDTNIRIRYHKHNRGGEDYFQFLMEMKKFWNELSDTIRELNEKYHIRPTRIIDMYNWAKSRK